MATQPIPDEFARFFAGWLSCHVFKHSSARVELCLPDMTIVFLPHFSNSKESHMLEVCFRSKEPSFLAPHSSLVPLLQAQSFLVHNSTRFTYRSPLGFVFVDHEENHARTVLLGTALPALLQDPFSILRVSFDGDTSATHEILFRAYAYHMGEKSAMYTLSPQALYYQALSRMATATPEEILGGWLDKRMPAGPTPRDLMVGTAAHWKPLKLLLTHYMLEALDEFPEFSYNKHGPYTREELYQGAAWTFSHVV